MHTTPGPAPSSAPSSAPHTPRAKRGSESESESKSESENGGNSSFVGRRSERLKRLTEAGGGKPVIAEQIKGSSTPKKSKRKTTKKLHKTGTESDDADTESEGRKRTRKSRKTPVLHRGKGHVDHGSGSESCSSSSDSNDDRLLEKGAKSEGEGRLTKLSGSNKSVLSTGSARFIRAEDAEEAATTFLGARILLGEDRIHFEPSQYHMAFVNRGALEPKFLFSPLSLLMSFCSNDRAK